jgi:calmodulin
MVCAPFDTSTYGRSIDRSARAGVTRRRTPSARSAHDSLLASRFQEHQRPIEFDYAVETRVPTPHGKRELGEAFSTADGNRDGRIDVAELEQLSRDLDAGMSNQELTLGFREVDTDRDGLIDTREFISPASNWWNHAAIRRVFRRSRFQSQFCRSLLGEGVKRRSRLAGQAGLGQAMPS